MCSFPKALPTWVRHKLDTKGRWSQERRWTPHWAIACEARIINDEMFLAAARSLADQVTEGDLATGTVYPPLSNIRSVSRTLAIDVAEKAFELGVAQIDKPTDLEDYIESLMYQPVYDTSA